MRVSLIQLNVGRDKAANLAATDEVVARAVAADAPRMVVLPELFAFMGGRVAEQREAADPVPQGETYRFLRRLAERHAVYVHGGSFMERDGSRYYNTTVAFAPDGAELARYRKIHLFDITAPDGHVYRESDSVDAGDRLVTYEADGATVGCTICYDLRFGELFKALAYRGARVIMVPAAFTLETGKDHWEVLLRARAIESQCYIVAPSQIGMHQTPKGVRSTWGHSLVVDPWGQVVAQASDTVGFVSATLDLDYVNRVRAALPSLQHAVLFDRLAHRIEAPTAAGGPRS
jgi:nitrilase